MRTVVSGQRRLFLFSLLCAGAVGMLAGWCALALVAAGLVVAAYGSWMALALLLAVLLLLSGFLVVPYRNLLRYGGQDAVSGALSLLLAVAGAALITVAVTAGVSGPMIYHVHYGERTEARVVATRAAESSEGQRVGTDYRLSEVATGRDLGWMDRGPKERAAKDEILEVSVDPHGWVAPVAAERLGYTDAPTRVLVYCLGAVALAALLVVAVALFSR